MKQNEETRVYLSRYPRFAGKWIYEGYAKAWQSTPGFEVLHPTEAAMDPEKYSYFFAFPITEEHLKRKYIIHTPVDTIGGRDALRAVERSQKAFLFVQPKIFPHPWGSHNNFRCQGDKEIIKELDKMDNVHLWTFANVNKDYYPQWTKKINTVPLAFDSIGYRPQSVPKYKEFDISFVGGWANNGFNEKQKIILDIFKHFKDSGLKCGFFVNKNLTHQQECDLLANSKITLNIHDAYQRVLGLDTNERTFKSLGLNGAMVSDSVEQLSQLFPNVGTSLDPQEIVNITKQYLEMPERELNDLKEKNKQNILENHCYTNRVQQLLSL